MMKHSACILALLIALAVCVPTFAQDVKVGGDIKIEGVYVDNVNDFDNDGGNISNPSEAGGGVGGPGSESDYYIPSEKANGAITPNDPKDDQDAFIRMEAHLWASVDLADNVSARISVESDKTFSNNDGILGTNSSTSSSSNYGVPSDDNLNIFLEEAYIEVREIGGYPVAARVGRQFIELGDGFVVGDSLSGNPARLSDLGEGEQDPFDALRVDIEPMENVVLTLIYSKQAETRNVQRDIDVYIANLAVSVLDKQHTIEAYYLFVKNDGFGNAISATQILDATGNVIGHNPPAGFALNSFDVHQAGLRISGKFFDQLRYHAEGTWQFADKAEFVSSAVEEGDLDAWAAEGGLAWDIPALQEWNGSLGATYTYFEGDDDPGDGDWNAYVQLLDNRTYGEVADFLQGIVTNNYYNENYSGVHIFNLDAKVTLAEKWHVALEGYYFIAAEDITAPNGDEDDSIGWEFDGYLGYDITENLSTNLASGFFVPDDAAENWAGDSDDTAWFVRGGVTVSF